MTCLACEAPCSTRYCSDACAALDRCQCGARADVVSGDCRVCALLVQAERPRMPKGSFRPGCPRRRSAYKNAWDALHRKPPPKRVPCRSCGVLTHAGICVRCAPSDRRTVTDDQVRQIRALRARGVSVAELARKVRVRVATAWNVINGVSGKHVREAA